jgi:hypothetical protein
MKRLICWLWRHRDCDIAPLRYYDHFERCWYRITRKCCTRCDRFKTVAVTRVQ